jgi:hypothetical protein
LYFLIKFINTTAKSIVNNVFLLFDNAYLEYYYRVQNEFVFRFNTRYFLEYFRAHFFESNYIYHWNNLWRGPSTLYSSEMRFKNEVNKSLFYVPHNKFDPKFWKFDSFYKNINFYVTSMYDNFRRLFGFGFYYLRGLCFILFIDACLTDDEPLWEPIEWSLVQTWILFIFSFAWIAENLIVSRYGSFTGRDKRVWMAWYKTFWLIEGYYALNYGVACVFFIIPFYFELNYNLSFAYSWWHWYSRVFFYKFVLSYSILLLIVYILQLNLVHINWKKGLIIILLVNIFISYLIYTHFIIVFFGYFTDPVWYQKTRPIDYIQLSHEPSRWGWGPAKKDHFTYHNVKTVFWFKNDGPFASSFLMLHLFLFVCIFFLFIFWLSLLRRVWATKELPITFTTYCVSSLRQFFYFFFFFYLFVFLSFIANYARLPGDFYFFLNNYSWLLNFIDILLNYPVFLLTSLF